MNTTGVSVTPTDDGLNWLLDDFVGRVVGVNAALLISRDGLQMAYSRMTRNQADKAAALMSGLHSLARNVGGIFGARRDGFRQLIVEDAGVVAFVVSAEHPRYSGERLVGSILAVLADPTAEDGLVAHEMSELVGSLADHLATRTRGGTGPGAGSGEGR